LFSPVYDSKKLKKAFKFEENITSMHVTYLSEIFEGDELELLLSQSDNNHICVLARRTNEQDNVYIMEITC